MVCKHTGSKGSRGNALSEKREEHGTKQSIRRIMACTIVMAIIGSPSAGLLDVMGLIVQHLVCKERILNSTLTESQRGETNMLQRLD